MDLACYALRCAISFWLGACCSFAMTIDLDTPVVRNGVPLTGWRASLALTLLILAWPLLLRDDEP